MLWEWEKESNYANDHPKLSKLVFNNAEQSAKFLCLEMKIREREEKWKLIGMTSRAPASNEWSFIHEIDTCAWLSFCHEFSRYFDLFFRGLMCSFDNHKIIFTIKSVWNEQTFGTFLFDDFSLFSFGPAAGNNWSCFIAYIRNAAVIRRLGQRGWADDHHMLPRAFNFFFAIFTFDSSLYI